MEDDFSQLEALGKSFDNLIKDFPNLRKEFIQECGEVMERHVDEGIASVNEFTGNYKEGKYKAYGSKGGWVAIRNNSPHAHLIEFGHRNVKGGTASANRKILKGKTNVIGAGNVIGFIPGKFIYKKAMLESIDEIETNLDKFLDKVGNKIVK